MNRRGKVLDALTTRLDRVRCMASHPSTSDLDEGLFEVQAEMIEHVIESVSGGEPLGELIDILENRVADDRDLLGGADGAAAGILSDLTPMRLGLVA